MRTRAVLRAVVVLFGASVALAVYWNWRPAETPEVPDERQVAEPGDSAVAAPDREEAVASTTENIYIVESKNGRDVFSIWASEQVDYVDGWNTWAEVRVVIHGDEGTDDDVEIQSERARTTGAKAGDFDEVVFIGSVQATLPSGGEFTTHRINYDAITGEVSNCNRNTLRYAGLQVRADCMEFQTAGDVSSATAVAEELRMWQDLSIQAADEGAGNMPEGLAGRADEMRFRPGGEFVRLDGEPQVVLAGTAISGDELVLDVGPDADELRGVEAAGSARVRLSGSAEDSSSRQTLEGDTISVQLAPEGGAVDRIVAATVDGAPAELGLRGFGTLRAGLLEVTPGERLIARAEDQVAWIPRRGDGALGELSAEDLRLAVADEELESLEADGGVRALLGGGGAEAREFTGERLVLGWVNGVMQRGAWPAGISLDVDGRQLSAGRANLDPETGEWILGGEEPPRVAAAEFAFSADELRLDPRGGVMAVGRVAGTIGGGYLAAAAALFGQAQAVQLKANEAEVEPDGSLRLGGKVEIVWDTQSLVAGEVLMESEPGRLRASRDIELVAVTGAEADFVTVSAQNLLVEEEASEVRVAGDAQLRQGRRRIAAQTMVVSVDENGDWSDVFAEHEVEFEDDRARGSGAELQYSMATRDLRLGGSAEIPALFVYDGVDPPAEYRSNEELRVSYNGDAIVIESTEDGRATTSVVPRQAASRE